MPSTDCRALRDERRVGDQSRRSGGPDAQRRRRQIAHRVRRGGGDSRCQLVENRLAITPHEERGGGTIDVTAGRRMRVRRGEQQAVEFHTRAAHAGLDRLAQIRMVADDLDYLCIAIKDCYADRDTEVHRFLDSADWTS